MCETNAYLVKEGNEELIMEDVALARPKDGKLELKDIFGEEKIVPGNIKEIQFLSHKMLIE
ncbi:MAG: CooT family nickel-binding protein [Deltaproteobacteria bacterium]|nr:CooT family nickel-binding protein [Deltaproteobacteria bacterium]MBW2122784.1 CooT family nickel-binding protein [Deltaproteobacteria bacterium]